MINRVKRILGRPRLSTATSIESYFGTVNRPGDYGGPTFEEAQKDFREIHSRFSAFRS